MSRLKRLLRGDALLYVTAYVTWGSVVVLFWNVLFQGVHGWIVALVLLAFGVLLALLSTERKSDWRRHIYMGIQAGLVMVLLLEDYGPWSAAALLYFVLCVYAMMLWPRPRRAGLTWIGVFMSLSVMSFVYHLGWVNGLLSLLPYSAGYFFFGVFAEVLARSQKERARSNRLLEELRVAHQQLQAYAAQVEELTVAEERNRLAHEMHDTLGHRLTVAAVQLEGAERLISRDPERAAHMVHTVREQVREALTELRRTVAALKSPVETDLALPQALTRLTEGFEEATGIAVHTAMPVRWTALPSAQRVTLYRVAQEGLTNVQRHAGARQVWLVLERQADAVTLTISDDGRGFSEGVEARGFGLRGIRERVEWLGGTCHFGKRPGGGAQVSVRLPTVEERDRDRNDG